MSDDLEFSIEIPLDENGLIGRECLECKKYFKIKPGTGLPTTYCHCPYCDYEGDSDTFWTTAQLKYIESIAHQQALNQIIKPSFDKMFKELERSTRNSLLKIEYKSSGKNYYVPIKYYTEKDLETNLTCDNCGLVFSIFGVFAQCPDCNMLNAFLIYEKSLEVTKKQFEIILNPEISKEIKENSFFFILSSCISAFDGLGKELRKRKPDIYPNRPKNLFQNLYNLNKHLNDLLNEKIEDFNFVVKLFQVRHIYEHNMGVIDEDFIQKLPSFSQKLGRKYTLNQKEIEKFIVKMEDIGNTIKNHYLNER